MGRRGPKPEPASVKHAKGNSGRRPIGDAPAGVIATTEIDSPKWLKTDGLRVWKRLAPQLVALKLLGKVDAETFARYCKNFGRWLRMQETLDKEGETYESESPHGKYKRAHPAFMIADRLERQLIAAEANFGLNPAERQRLFAARASGSLGDLFGNSKESGKANTPAPAPSENPVGTGSAVGYLN